MYGLGQGTTIVATTGVSAYGPQAMSNGFNAIKAKIPTKTKPFNANPFKHKSPADIDAMFKSKGFTTSGPDPVSGKGGYINPKNGRSYHIDFNNSYNEAPHVDVNRLRGYKGDLTKKKFFIN